jgi:SAM-dependent methyltransferase
MEEGGGAEWCDPKVYSETVFPPPGAAETDRVRYQEHALEVLRRSSRYAAWQFERCRPYLGERVLDVGAGLGTFTELAARHAEVVAVEPEDRFASLLRTRFDGHDRVAVVCLRAEDLEPTVLGGPFDSVLCLNVLEHIEDDVDVLRRLCNQLRPSGHLLLLVPAHQRLYGPTDEAIGHFRRYAKQELRDKLVRAGLASVELRHVNPVGWVAWFFYARVLRRAALSTVGARSFDLIVPLVRPLDSLHLHFGLSLWAIARPAG